MTLGCIAVAVLPDADLLVRGFHRSATHSIGATLLVMIVAIVVTGWVTPPNPAKAGSPFRNDEGLELSQYRRRQIAWRVVIVFGAAHASHVALDWLGADWFSPPGIQALWPFSDGWFISGWDLFPRIERRNAFSSATIISNLKAVAHEIAVVGPIALVMWWLRRGGA